VQLESRSSTTEIHVAAAMAAVAGPDFLAGGGEMGALMRAKDWSQTPLGPVETWSPTLRMMTGFLLANRFPLLLWWGPQYLSIYNDAYRPILGNKHPDYLGRPVAECWSEIWHVLKPLIDKPFNGGPATWMDDIQLEINRYGFVEETHFTVAYSPVPDESAPRGIGGVLATVHEITEKVIGERRLQALGDLGRRATEARTAETACAIAAETLADHARDMPFALIYLLDEDGRHARLAGTTGLGMDEAASPRVIDLSHGAADSTGWPLAEAVHGEAPITVEDLRERFGQARGRCRRIAPCWCRSAPTRRTSWPACWWRASARCLNSTRFTSASSTWSARRSPPRSPTRAPMKKSASARRRWRRSIVPRPCSSPTSAMNSARH
jgi:hypothetical protein